MNNQSRNSLIESWGPDDQQPEQAMAQEAHWIWKWSRFPINTGMFHSQKLTFNSKKSVIASFFFGLIMVVLFIKGILSYGKVNAIYTTEIGNDKL